jgi:hypothetical protein
MAFLGGREPRNNPNKKNGGAHVADRPMNKGRGFRGRGRKAQAARAVKKTSTIGSGRGSAPVLL